MKIKQPRVKAAAKRAKRAKPVAPTAAKRMPDKEWFVSRIRDAGLTRRKVALSMGQDPSAFARTLTGDRRPQLDEVVALASTLNVGLDQIAGRLGYVSVERKVPQVGTVSGEARITFQSSDADAPCPPFLPADGRVLRCETLNSPLALWDESLLYYVREPGVTPDTVGRLCVIETSDRTVLGSLFRGSARGRYKVTLVGIGETFQPTAVVSASPVLWIKMP